MTGLESMWEIKYKKFLFKIKFKFIFNYSEGGQTLEQVFQQDYGVFIKLGMTMSNLLKVWTEVLDYIIFQGHFQFYSFCGSGKFSMKKMVKVKIS